MWIALLALAAVFALLFAARVGGARRVVLIERWPALLFALAAMLAAFRGALWPAAILGALAAGAWALWPQFRRPSAPVRQEDPADTQARAVLGVRLGASEADIRASYRAKMAQAHPDRGGSHAAAAALTAARDRLLRALTR